MENILPIIIALLYFGYRQYKKNIESTKVQKETIAPGEEYTEEEKSQGSSFDEFIGNFMGLEDEVINNDIKNYRELHKESDFDQEEEIDISNIKSEPEVIKHHDKKTTPKEEDKQFRTDIHKGDSIAENTDFDLRQAIIYDAVINPPYINK